MDDKGFIFTTDATLALVVFMVFTASFITYQIMPNFMGEDHQHLEALADSALAVMEQDGTLNAASINYAAGNQSGGSDILNTSLYTILPSDVGYKLILGSNPPVYNDRGLLSATDTVTRVRVISGPKEGWVGRAWYKLEEVEFENQTQNVTTTLWNFHNWLTNFSPWSNNNHLVTYPYWGGGSNPQNIQFSIPNGATILGGNYLVGSANRERRGRSYGVDVLINGIHHVTANTSFTFLNYMPTTDFNPEYNFQGNIPAAELNTGVNNFNVNFNTNTRSTQDLPWFSIIANYTTQLEVPKGLITTRTPFNNAAGMAVQTAQDLDGNGVANEFGRIYNINTGTVTSFTNLRRTSWNSFYNLNSPTFENGVPFVMTNVPNIGTTTCVSVIQDINIPANSRIFDGFTVVNAYGAVDGAMVEVWDGTRWNTAFYSFGTYSGVSNGYGNTPGIIYIRDFLNTGNNKVRITIWDVVPGNDYDLVGLQSCYSTVTTSQLPIKWENFPYNSYQSTNNQRTQTRTFTVGPEAQKVLLFVGAGLDTRNFAVDYGNSTTLYNSAVIPYSLDLSALDAAGPHVFTTGTPGNYTLKNGTYTLRVNVTAPSNGWESGDNNAELFSGTRIAVIYPKFLENVWKEVWGTNAAYAEQQALIELNNTLNRAFNNGSFDYGPYIKTEAIYAGDLPNAIPVRLELWRK
ncbi:MAG: hypothetical protein HZC47_07635 [Methanobacterium sp.]|uniref:hypothetical protein n=1 Tax=Methanobacterium sp. TaxID=2164 RepID=UPI003D64C943|nr:hypothetical protein [Methanobacterium sp.]